MVMVNYMLLTLFLMGHPNNAVLKETSKFHNIQLIGVHHRPCPRCAKVKNHMKNIHKERDSVATKNGENLVINISWVKTTTIADNCYWLFIMDEYTHYLWSYILNSKDETKQKLYL
jgi:hypothetical protein